MWWTKKKKITLRSLCVLKTADTGSICSQACKCTQKRSDTDGYKRSWRTARKWWSMKKSRLLQTLDGCGAVSWTSLVFTTKWNTANRTEQGHSPLFLSVSDSGTLLRDKTGFKTILQPLLAKSWPWEGVSSASWSWGWLTCHPQESWLASGQLPTDILEISKLWLKKTNKNIHIQEEVIRIMCFVLIYLLLFCCMSHWWSYISCFAYLQFGANRESELRESRFIILTNNRFLLTRSITTARLILKQILTTTQILSIMWKPCLQQPSDKALCMFLCVCVCLSVGKQMHNNSLMFSLLLSVP